ncbi:MAG: hypothetical protein EA417_12245 [Gammaproteobacteria bacterium]|nr:MAG: hypothetical protein EA417_12245 [Gammaproteobacteria bacterium]
MLRWLGILVGVIVVLAVIAVVVVTQRLDGWVKDGIETYGPQYTGVAVTVDSVSLSLLSGRGAIRGLRVANPDGYDGDYAMQVGRIEIALRPLGVLDDPVIIDVIEIEGAEVHAQSRDLRDTNLQVILRNVRAATPPPAEDEEAAGPQLIIERFTLTDTEASVTAARLGAVAVRVPDIELTEVGRRSNGASIGQVLQQVLEPLIAVVLTSMAEGRVREQLEERGEELRGRAEEEADRLRERMRQISPF